MSNFAILRTEKIKSLGEMKRRSNHNARTSEAGLEHTDPNRSIALIEGQDDAVKAWHERAEAIGFDKSKMRKNAVVGIEFLATASKDWWDSADAETREAWTTKTMAFVAKQAGGKENILSAHFHDDEETPHLQVITSPFIEKEMNVRGRKRAGSAPKPARKAWALSAKDLIGGHRDHLIQMQTDYATEVADLGLRRGIPRKETGARNLAPAKWRAAKAAELDQQQANTAQTEETLSQSRTEAQRVVSTADDRAEALHIGFEAVGAGELFYRPPTTEKDEGLAVKRADEGSILPPKGQHFQAFVSHVQPYLKTLLAYAKRLSVLSQREAQVEQDAQDVEAVREATNLEKSAKIEAIRQRRDAPSLRSQLQAEAKTKRPKRQDER